MPVNPARARSVFLVAADLKDPIERRAFLDRECDGDVELRAQVAALLRVNDSLPSFSLETSAAHPHATASHIEDHRHPTAGVGAVLIGKYKLIQEIGKGGMGSVYMAQQTEPVKRTVAVKVIKAGMDSKEVLARFETERQALALMDHPNIARVLDAGTTEGGRPFVVMELVKGVPITQHCDERKLTPRQRLELFVPVCQAIQHAHQKGIIHRDIKPSNVLVAVIDDRPVPKVIDFGVAKAAGQSLTDMTLLTGLGAIVGTPEYMSPEQASLNNPDIDTRSDVYSLGVLLYELLTGSTPVDRKSLGKAAVLEILRVVREVDAPRPSAKLSTIDALPNVAANRGTEPARLSKLMKGELDWLVLKALEKDRTRRYETANALAAEVQRYLAGEPVQAVPPSAGYRVRKLIRRNRTAVLTAAAFALLLLAGAGISTWQAVVATRAEAEANTQRAAAEKALGAEAAARIQADEARGQTELALDASRRMAARMNYERAQELCEQGEADLGLLWMSRSLELTPVGAHELDRAIRTSINQWARTLSTFDPSQSDVPGWGFNTEILDIKVSPDGHSVLVLENAYPNAIGGPRLYDLSTGKLRSDFRLEDDAPQSGPFADCHVAFSPNGQFVAATRGDSFARVWNTAKGGLAGMPLAHRDAVRGISFDSTGELLATASGNIIHFWRIDQGSPDGEPLTLEYDALGVEISHDGRLLLAWGPDRIELWELPSRKLLRPLAHVDFAVVSAALSQNCNYVLANGVQEAQFWEVGTGEPIGARMRWNDRVNSGWNVHRCAIRADSRVAVTGGFPIRLWSVPLGEPLGATSLAAESYFPAFTPDGKRLVVERRVVDIAHGLFPEWQFTQTDQVADLVAGPDGKSLATLEWESQRRTIRLVDLPAGNPVGEPIEYVANQGRVPLPVFSPNGRNVAILAGNPTCELRDPTTGRPSGPPLAMDDDIRAVAFSPDGNTVATGDLGGLVRIWNLSDSQPTGKVLRHRRPIWRLCFSPDGKKLLAAGGDLGGRDGEARVWRVETGDPLGPSLAILGTVHDAAFNPDGKSFALGAFQLSVWDAETSRQQWTDSRPDIGQISYSPDGSQLLARSWTMPATGLFDARIGVLLANFKHQTGTERSEFSPDGKLVVTSGTDMVTQLWDAATGLPVGPSWKNVHEAPRVVFADHGRSVILSDGKVVSRWEIAPPLEGTREQIRLTIQVMTRLFLDERGETLPLAPRLAPETASEGKTVLTADPYEPAWKRLKDLGGPAGEFRR